MMTPVVEFSAIGHTGREHQRAGGGRLEARPHELEWIGADGGRASERAQIIDLIFQVGPDETALVRCSRSRSARNGPRAECFGESDGAASGC